MSKLNLNPLEKIAFDYIQSPQVKDLYLDIIEFSRGLKNLKNNQHNFPAGKKHITYHDYDKDYVFSFIINKNHLRFYLRSHALKKCPSIVKSTSLNILNLDNKHTETKHEYACNFDTKEELDAIKEIITYYSIDSVWISIVSEIPQDFDSLIQ